MPNPPPKPTRTELLNRNAMALYAQSPAGTPTPTLAEEPEKKREGSTKFTTNAMRAWVKAQGWMVINSERYDYRSGRYADAPWKMDGWYSVRGRIVAVQAGQPGEERDHLRSFVGVYGFDRAAEHFVTILWLEFERSNPEPLRIARWCIAGRRASGYSEAEVRGMIAKKRPTTLTNDGNVFES
jgi:hypothetical protein